MKKETLRAAPQPRFILRTSRLLDRAQRRQARIPLDPELVLVPLGIRLGQAR